MCRPLEGAADLAYGVYDIESFAAARDANQG